MNRLILFCLAFAFIKGALACTSTNTATSNTPAATSYIRCTTTAGATCRLATSCNSGENRLPASATYATEAACKAYIGKALCYDFAQTTPALQNYGTCVDDYVGCGSKITLSNTLQDSLCGDYGFSWVRCMSFSSGTGTPVCRPYGAGCNTGEAQQPNATNARTAASLSSRYLSLQECKDVTPYYPCWSMAVVAPVLSCQLDTVQNCPTNMYRLDSGLFFANLTLCNAYLPARWQRCQLTSADADFKCIPYDNVTLPTCPISTTVLTNGNRVPSNVFFDSAALCTTAYAYAATLLCWHKNNLVFSCAAACADPLVQVASYSSVDECQRAVVTDWTRCINPTLTAPVNTKRCVPTAAKAAACATPFIASPAGVSYASQNACISDIQYSLCYCKSLNQMMCMQDYLGCDDLGLNDCTNVFASAPPYANLSSCLAAAPTAYSRCMNKLSGQIACRPTIGSQSGCYVDAVTGTDLQTASGTFTTLESCAASASYYYCIDQSTPEVIGTCVLDVDVLRSCPAPTTSTMSATSKRLARSDSNAAPLTFATMSACQAFYNTTNWMICHQSASTSTKTCRIYNSEMNAYAATLSPLTCVIPAVTTPAIPLEVATSTNKYSTLVDCIKARST